MSQLDAFFIRVHYWVPREHSLQSNDPRYRRSLSQTSLLCTAARAVLRRTPNCFTCAGPNPRPNVWKQDELRLADRTAEDTPHPAGSSLGSSWSLLNLPAVSPGRISLTAPRSRSSLLTNNQWPQSLGLRLSSWPRRGRPSHLARLRRALRPSFLIRGSQGLCV